MFPAVYSSYAELARIANPATTPDIRTTAMRSFAQELDWVPSYEVPGTFGVDAVAGHLIVEHGLYNAAAISFLKTPARAVDLRPDQLKSLLGISYNNLIEWHLFVSRDDARCINNLADRAVAPEADRPIRLSPEGLLSSISFSGLNRQIESGLFPRPIRPCDDALIKVISRWKRLLKADYPELSNTNLSSLFNSLIFVRGCEDRNFDVQPGSTRLLLNGLTDSTAANIDIVATLESALLTLQVGSQLSEFVDVNALSPFERLDAGTAFNLLHDFYIPRDAGYEFNFALMSKHALSRIYEKYVAIFQSDDSEADTEQFSFINTVPATAAPYKTGSVYTPQFIAGFFARFMRDNMTPRAFRDLRSIDPACGSGLFLRTMLELQCDPSAQATLSSIERSFSRTEGIDKDVNACEATRLSLPLLHLIVSGSLPRAADLRVTTADAIRVRLEGSLIESTYGAVITNPPWVKLDHLDPHDLATYKEFLTDWSVGRIDAYIPFVKLCLELATPGGFICLVLPQTFLSAKNTTVLRRRIFEGYDVRCLVDLSAVPIFKDLGAYTVLLILQRRTTVASGQASHAQVAIVTEQVGAALDACLDGRQESNAYYTVFPVPQNFFRGSNWQPVSPAQLAIDTRISDLPRLWEYMQVAQGFVTGADRIFIRHRELVPPGEEQAYVDFLPDRQIGRYSIPKRTAEVVFFPFDGTRPLTEAVIRKRFPQTWAYLESHENELRSRRSVKGKNELWWKPVRSRDPGVILRPKIVCPHLMLTSRFAVDVRGSFAVSHSPFIVSRQVGDEQALLRFFCAVLNSTVCSWYLRVRAPKYSNGYNRLEVNVLREAPVPRLGSVDSRTLAQISELVEIVSKKLDTSLDNHLDAIICELYGFTITERQTLLGLG